MTNDLSTIEGCLQEAIDKLENNLLDKGVVASYNSNDGYFDLLDEILNITTSEPIPSMEIIYDANVNKHIGAVGSGHFIYATGYSNATIDWGDGQTTTSTGSFSHTYQNVGIYHIKIYNITGLKDASGSYPIFKDASGIKQIIIHNDITYIGNNQIRDCTRVTDIIFDYNANITVGEYFCHGCSNLVNVILPNNIPSIPDYAFQSCTNLTNITLPSTVSSIGLYAFGFSSLAKINIETPSSITNLPSYGVFYNTLLFDIVYLPNITAFPGMMYARCYNLTDITIPGNIITIGESAFEWDSNLTNIVIEEGVESFSNRVFARCGTIDNIHLPTTLTTIGNWIFDRSTVNNYHLYWTTSPLTYNSGKMPAGNDTKFYIPQNTTSIYVNAGYPSDKLIERTE